jgi:hypothetical protein
MTSCIRDWIFLAFVLLIQAGGASAEPGYITFPSDVDWMTRRSSHFEIVYRRGETAFAERALIAAEKAHALLSPIFPDAPARTYLVLADFKDSLNGYAIDFPYPHMVIFASPPEGSSTLSSLDEWLESVILHEYVHVLHLYPSSGLWRTARAVFGSWVLPNGLMPSHLHEGLAVFLETELGLGGRGKSADFRMYRRMAVKDGKWGNDFAPIDLLEGSAVHWPHGHSPYFFGYWVWKEVWDQKKAKGIHDIVADQSGNWPYWISRPFEQEIGEEYPTLWKKIYDKGTAEATQEIQEIEKHGVSPQKFLTETRFNKWDLVVSPDSKKAALRSSRPENGSRIEILNLADISAVDSFEPDGGSEQGLCYGTIAGREHLIYVDSKMEAGYQTFILKVRAVSDKSSHEIEYEKWRDEEVKVEHVHALSCSNDLLDLAVYTEHAGKGSITTLRALPSTDSGKFPKYRKVKTWGIPNKTWVSSVLAGKSTYAVLRDRNGSSLYRYSDENELSGKKVGALSSRHFYGLVTDASNRVYAVGAEEGRNELYEVNKDSGALTKKVAVLGGLDSVAFASDGKLYALSYRHGGYDLALLEGHAPAQPRRIPVVIERKPANEEMGSLRSQPQSAADLQFEAEDEYSAWGSLSPRAWIPNLLIVPDGMQISAWIPGFDIAQRNTYSLFGGYDTRGSPFIQGSYAHRFLRQTNFQTEAFYSPSYLISARGFLKTWGASLGLSTVFGFMDPRFTFSAQFRRVEGSRLGPDKQSVGFGVSSTHAFGFKSRPQAVSPHRGTRLSVGYSHFFKSLGSTDEYDSFTASADQYMSSPWLASHIFFLGARAGYTDGTVIYNSFFQGGGELIFSQGRGFFLNRGFVPGSFLGRRMFALNMEYRFPLWDVYRGMGLWPFFLQRIHAAVITDVLTFDYGTKSTAPKDLLRVFYGSVGVELKSDWKLFYYMPATIRLGLYRGIGANQFYGIRGEPLYVTLAAEGGLF